MSTMRDLYAGPDGVEIEEPRGVVISWRRYQELLASQVDDEHGALEAEALRRRVEVLERELEAAPWSAKVTLGLRTSQRDEWRRRAEAAEQERDELRQRVTGLERERDAAGTPYGTDCATRLRALRYQVERGGCAGAHYGETTIECGAEACGLCALRQRAETAEKERDELRRRVEVLEIEAIEVHGGHMVDVPESLSVAEAERVLRWYVEEAGRDGR